MNEPHEVLREAIPNVEAMALALSRRGKNASPRFIRRQFEPPEKSGTINWLAMFEEKLLAIADINPEGAYKVIEYLSTAVRHCLALKGPTAVRNTGELVGAVAVEVADVIRVHATGEPADVIVREVHEAQAALGRYGDSILAGMGERTSPRQAAEGMAA